MDWSETEKKYFAGLFDADACLVLQNNNGYASLTLCIELSESIDKDGRLIKYLSSKVGRSYSRDRKETWAKQNSWIVSKRNDLEITLPHIIKHMVVKGKKWQYLLNKFRELKAVKITQEDINNIRIEADKLLGPVSHKNHPTWAWTAGYLDGDGWYLKRVRHNQIEMHVGAVSHIDHIEGLELLYKAFGGVLKDDRGHKRWIRNLGPRDKSFAINFLRKMVQHSKMKKWKHRSCLHQ
jgi:intein/homing endonuclease